MSTDYSYLYISFYGSKITFDSNIVGDVLKVSQSVDGVLNTTKWNSEEHSDVAADTLDGHRLWLGRWYDGNHDLTTYKSIIEHYLWKYYKTITDS